MKKQVSFRLAIVLAFILLTGCAPLRAISLNETPTSVPATETPAQPTRLPALTQVTSGPGFEEGSEPANCAYVWDSRPLEMETNMVQAAFQARGMEDVSVRLQAYGENCIDPDTNQIVRFTTMETDFYLSIQTGSLEDTETMGNQLADSLQVLRAFPEDTFPGPMPGRVFASFNARGQIQNISFDMQQAGKALDKNLRGAALLEALSQP